MRRDMRWAVIGRCWDPTPKNICLAIKNRRDWFEREVKRLEDIIAAEREKIRTLETVIGYLESEAAPTPDRSGEADKTGTGLTEGESGLPEGSSK